MAFRLSDGAAGDRKEVTGDANFEQLGDDHTAAGLLVLLADQHFRVLRALVELGGLRRRQIR